MEKFSRPFASLLFTGAFLGSEKLGLEKLGTALEPPVLAAPVFPAEILVMLEAGKPPDAVSARAARFGITASLMPTPHLEPFAYVFRVPQTWQVDALIDALEEESFVLAVERNGTVSASGEPNDPYYFQQWHLPFLHCPQAWNVSKGSNVCVAVLDSGVNFFHPDLASKYQGGFDHIHGDSIPEDNHGHGTAVSGIIAADTNNGAGVAGIGWNSSFVLHKVLELNSQTGKASGSHSAVAAGIVAAAKNPQVRVMNLSLGSDNKSDVIEEAIELATSKGIVVVAAAGNESTNDKHYPAAYDDVISVAATTSTGSLAWFSNYGSWVDVAAPGVSVMTTHKDFTYSPFSGTSAASPVVAGEAALLFAALSGLDPCKPMDEFVRSVISDTASGPTPYVKSGLIDIGAALQWVASQTPSDDPDSMGPKKVKVTSPWTGGNTSGLNFSEESDQKIAGNFLTGSGGGYLLLHSVMKGNSQQTRLTAEYKGKALADGVEKLRIQYYGVGGALSGGDSSEIKLLIHIFNEKKGQWEKIHQGPIPTDPKLITIVLDDHVGDYFSTCDRRFRIRVSTKGPSAHGLLSDSLLAEVTYED